MKNMKKIASVVLALIMALALMVPAFADEGGPMTTMTPPNKIDDLNPEVADIIIRVETPEGGVEKGETYTVYKIFEASIAGEKGNMPSSDPLGMTSTFENISYTIKSDSPFYATVKDFEDENGNKVFELNLEVGSTTTYVVTRNKVNDVEVLYDAAKLAAKLKEDVIDKAGEDFNWNGIKVLENVQSGFTVENTGYYLITSSLGSKMIVDTIGQGDMTIKTKNDLPTLDKTIIVPVIGENNAPGTEKVDSTTASYGDTVTFELAVRIPATAVGPMTVHDKMDSDLTYVDLTEDSFEAAVTPGDETGEGVTVCTKHFTISAEQVAAEVAKAVEVGADGTTVYIRYTATLNSDALTAKAIKNIAHLAYSQYETPDDEVEVYTYEFDLIKTKSDNTPLAGATFTLGMDLVKVEDNVYRVAVEGDSEENIVTEFTTDETGKILIKGLANGTYTLTETEAPDGYNKLLAPVTVTIENANNNVTNDLDGNNHYVGGAHIINLTGAELPSTGGIGTTIFYVVGGILVVAAAILLVTRKRMNDQ